MGLSVGLFVLQHCCHRPCAKACRRDVAADAAMLAAADPSYDINGAYVVEERSHVGEGVKLKDHDEKLSLDLTEVKIVSGGRNPKCSKKKRVYTTLFCTSLSPNLSVKNEKLVLVIFTFYLPRHALRPYSPNCFFYFPAQTDSGGQFPSNHGSRRKSLLSAR